MISQGDIGVDESGLDMDDMKDEFLCGLSQDDAYELSGVLDMEWTEGIDDAGGEHGVAGVANIDDFDIDLESIPYGNKCGHSSETVSFESSASSEGAMDRDRCALEQNFNVAMPLPMNPALNIDASQLQVDEKIWQLSGALQRSQPWINSNNGMLSITVEDGKKDRRGSNLSKGIEKKRRQGSGSPRNGTARGGMEDNATQYKCGYCGVIKSSLSAGKDGHVRIRCECGAKHGDRKPRMHAKWHMVKKAAMPASAYDDIVLP